MIEKASPRAPSGRSSRGGAIEVTGETLRAHRPPVGDGVELEVQLVREVERNDVGTLRLDDALILVEDDVLELLEHRVGLLEVVVAAHDDVAGAALGPERLRGEEVHHLFAAAPAQSE